MYMYIHVSCKCTDMGLLEFIDADYTYSLSKYTDN